MTGSAKPEKPLWGCYERLRPAQIEQIRAQTPLAYVPWGALEWHSYHAPVGLDGMQAHGQCCALAAATGGVVLPAFYVGTDTIKPFKGFPHSVEHSAETVRRLCREILKQLVDESFHAIVIVTGHCGGAHVEALQATVDAFAADYPAIGVRLIPSFDPIADTYPSNHAAFGETALQLHFASDLVDLSLLPSDRESTLDDDGVWGQDPRNASAEAGQRIVALFVERTLPLIQPLLTP